MIAYLKGTVLNKSENSLILVNNDIGYDIRVTKKILNKIVEEDDLELFIHTHVREDEISLFGFDTQEEMNFFKNLISISGIGPKIALEVLNFPIPELKKAIFDKNIDYFKQIKGLGKKTSERIFLDMKCKITPDEIECVSYSQERREIKDDIFDAVLTLGYSRKQVIKALKNLPEEITDDEEIIKFIIQNV